MKPTCEQIEKLASAYTVIPICKEIYADISTPITLLRKISQISKRYYLLESIEGGERWGRYSFLGFHPIMHLTCKDGIINIENANGEIEKIQTKKPLSIVRKILAQYKSPRLPDKMCIRDSICGFFIGDGPYSC